MAYNSKRPIKVQKQERIQPQVEATTEDTPEKAITKQTAEAAAVGSNYLPLRKLSSN